MSLLVAEKMGAAESLPPELMRYALAIQLGYELHWSAMRALLRNGLLSRRYGTWVLTTVGLSAAGIAREAIGAGQLSADEFSGGFRGESEHEPSTGSGPEFGSSLAPGSGGELTDEDWASRFIGIDTGRFDLSDSHARRFAPSANGSPDAPVFEPAPKPESEQLSRPEESGKLVDDELRHLIPGLVAEQDLVGASTGSATGTSTGPVADGEFSMNFSVVHDAKGWRWTAIS